MYNADKLTEEEIEMIKETIQEKLGDGIILLISLTGSRAFGWADDKYDYDLHGVFYKPNYWDWVHVGERKLFNNKHYGLDINMYSLGHIAEMDLRYGHFEVMMNMSNPIYSHPLFKIEMLWNLFPKETIKYLEHDIISQMNRFKMNTSSPRTALHSYRIAMLPIYYLETGRIKLNVFELNKEFFNSKFTQLEALAQSYVEKQHLYNTDIVINELDELFTMWKTTVEKYKDLSTNRERINIWYATLIKLLESEKQ
ncbi:MAG: hypothetical protein DRG33_00920 [Deltaproteobacteria bacterium]|nr:MAG: hypothetical protein DRG33_00920 [Deltaproteobacteria bacterium]